MESYSAISKKKRFSLYKPNEVNYKISYSLKKNDFSFYQKSNSVNKKKLRLHTDYTDNQYGSSFGNYMSNYNHYKSNMSTKNGQCNLKRKDSQNKAQKNSLNVTNINLNQYKFKKQFASNNLTTKYDPKKNNQMKLLFCNNSYQSKIKNHKKSKQSSNNFSIYLNNSKKKAPSTPNHNNYIMLNSPYNQQINNFMKMPYQRTNISKDKQGIHISIPKLKEKNIKDIILKQSSQSKDNKSKKSSSIHKVAKSKNKKIQYEIDIDQKDIQLNKITKNNIRLKTSVGIQQNQDDQFNFHTNKQKNNFNSHTTKGANSVNNSKFFSKRPNSNNKNDKNINNGNPLKNKQFQQQQQSTVKTIKKQQNSNQNQNKNKIKQLQSSRITSQCNSNQQDDNYGMTQQQIQTFGDRFPYGFQKIKLLGRGGFSLVWLGKHIKSGKQFAIKQIITNNTHQTHIKQIWFGTMYFTLGGIPKPQFAIFPGIKNLVRLYSYQINQTDTWIFYQKCGKSLGTSLYDIKSQKIYGDEKLYKIHYKPFYLAMQKNPSILTSLIVQICKSLTLLNQCQIVHSDLKTQNILLKYNQQKNFQITELKLIDYGSSFQFRNIAQFSMATPQYMPPQILNYIIHQNQGVYQQDLYEQVMTNYQNPWAVDIWSLGCVVLQIVVGVPLWMSLPLLVPNKIGKSYLQKQGLFAVKGRLFPQIITKQRQVISRLPSVLQKQNYSRIFLSQKMKKVLKGMLQIDFNKRMSPMQIIQILSDEVKSI